MTELKHHLATRRSISIPDIKAPAPEGEELDSILRLAVRVPDHGKLAPWRMILIRGDAAAKLGETMADIAENKEGPLSEARRAFELDRFTRAPLVIAVVSRAGPHFKIPEWEQVLSAGALTMNLIHAMGAHGYAATWLTEWPAYDDEGKAALGISEDEKVAGFLYVGTPADERSERPRPELSDIVTLAKA
ncbi:nitroreductase [Aureimonas altamirensis]|uniref:nitroreductase family protein n=1 Tax=Aureimonas altamirensis TaxID=370622 RepID=UPI0020374640|nr:nitroreductase [Aureimonas altamirensis]MCM2505287.1 nitroreductase [Aureimonas altamirensis]